MKPKEKAFMQDFLKVGLVLIGSKKFNEEFSVKGTTSGTISQIIYWPWCPGKKLGRTVSDICLIITERLKPESTCYLIQVKGLW